VKKGNYRKSLIESQIKMVIEDEDAPGGFIGQID
jgi:hypothetical protein